MSEAPRFDGGDDLDDSDRWEQVGRKLLVQELETVLGMDIQSAFTQLTRRVRKGEEITAQDISDARNALEQAEQIINMAAEASPETAPPPDLFQFLDEDAQRQYAEEFERRDTESQRPQDKTSR